jgi:hypothetical protein
VFYAEGLQLLIRKRGPVSLAHLNARDLRSDDSVFVFRA